MITLADGSGLIGGQQNTPISAPGAEHKDLSISRMGTACSKMGPLCYKNRHYCFKTILPVLKKVSQSLQTSF